MSGRKMMDEAKREAQSSGLDNTATQMAQMKKILNDYTKKNSWLMRILTGHWNRHHVKDVHNIVEKIDKGRLENPAQVFQELEKISEKQGVNPSGSFKRRLDFMKNEINQEPSGPTSSN